MRQLTARRPATPVLLAITTVLAVCAVEFTFHVSGGLRSFLNSWVYDNIVFASGAACLARRIADRKDREAWILMGLAGVVLLAWAAWQPASPRAYAKTEGWSLLVPTVAFRLVALGIQIWDHFHPVNPLALALSGAALLAVIARMAMSFAQNMASARESRAEARTDPLTGLGNRRRLFDDLDGLFQRADEPHVLVLFDLNGFKFYNDTFGHVAGDMLLARLGESLRKFVTGRGHAYRMGGDEFCIVVRNHGPETELVVAGAARALSEHGEGFAITAANGWITLPDEAGEADEALRVADQRMYQRKQRSHGGWASPTPRSSRRASRGAARGREDGGPGRDPREAGPVDGGRVAVPARPHRDRRAHPRGRAGPDVRRRPGALVP